MSRPDIGSIVHSPSAETFLRMVTKGFYDNSYTGLWMYEVIGREWDEMRQWAEGLKNEIHPQTCTWSIGIWEWVYGFERDETLSLESRRQRILAKVISTRPINPEAIRHGVAKITGCDVDIKDFAGPYRFSLTIHMPEEGETLPYKSVREYIRTVKPAHLAAFLTWAFHADIDCAQMEQFLCPRMCLHWYMPFWGQCLFDGSWDFDGSVLMDAVRRYNLVPGIRYYAGRFHESDSLHLFDGSWDFDGSVLMDAAYRGGFLAAGTKIYGQPEKMNAGAGIRFRVEYFDILRFDGSWKWDGGRKLNACRFVPAVKAHVGIKTRPCREDVGNAVLEIRRNLWFFDGSVKMDGSRILNSEYRKEEL